VVSPSSLELLIERARGVIILDEAYSDYSGAGDAQLTTLGSRVLSVRTMSKAYGLAGLRIGYAIGAEDLIAEVEKSRGPYKVNALAEEAATAALTSDVTWVNDKVKRVIANRERFRQALLDMGLSPLPSDANFVLVPVSRSTDVSNRMRERGVAVRPFEKLPCIGDSLRISVGPWEMMEEALRALQESLK
jgi:histidinol-phosphate/aromatic aminotransferase/cobyric acid decarboxylase-like protein